MKVNVDENQRLALQYDARSIPTLLVMRDGTVVERIVGALPKPELTAQDPPPPQAAAGSIGRGGRSIVGSLRPGAWMKALRFMR